MKYQVLAFLCAIPAYACAMQVIPELNRRLKEDEEFIRCSSKEGMPSVKFSEQSRIIARNSPSGSNKAIYTLANFLGCNILLKKRLNGHSSRPDEPLIEYTIMFDTNIFATNDEQMRKLQNIVDILHIEAFNHLYYSDKEKMSDTDEDSESLGEYNYEDQ